MRSRPMPHVDGVTHRFVEVNGVQLHVAEAGAGEPLLLPLYLGLTGRKSVDALAALVTEHTSGPLR